MRILFSTQWFTPEPFFKGLDYVKRLKDSGHDVYVLTGFPNYPGGKVYEGYKIRAFQQECLDGIPVLRTALFPSHDRSAVRRIANYLSFALSSAVFGLLKTPKVDVVYVYHPPATAGLAALVFKFLKRIPFVYEIQDLWPDTLEATGLVRSRFLVKLAGAWCRFLYRHAGKVVVISAGFKKKLVARGVAEDRIEVIYNCCDEKHIFPRRRDEGLAENLGLSGKFNIMFAGNMGLAQALDSVLDAAALLAKDHPQIQFVFIGGGVDSGRLKKRAQDMQLANALFLNSVPPSEIGEIFMLADAMLVHLKDDPLFEVTIPGKIQAYMASGKPVIVGVKGDAADVVHNAQAGISCLPENPQSIADAAVAMYRLPQNERDALGKNARTFYEQEFSLDVGLRKLNSVFQLTLQR